MFGMLTVTGRRAGCLPISSRNSPAKARVRPVKVLLTVTSDPEAVLLAFLVMNLIWMAVSIVCKISVLFEWRACVGSLVV